MKIQTGSVYFFSLLLVLILSVNAPAAMDSLESNFVTPPENFKPWCYWYWLNNDVTKDGITKDLEAMKNTGIIAAFIGNIEGGGPVKMFSPEWYRLTRHALKEGNRLGIDIWMFNAPGWSQSGGPWIDPDQSMRRVIWNEIPAQGGAFSAKVRNEPQKINLETHTGVEDSIMHEPQDIAVLAVPRKNRLSVFGQRPKPKLENLSFAKASWIWFPGENAAVEAPSETRLFKRIIKVDSPLEDARVMLTADNAYILKVNGVEVNRDDAWTTIDTVVITDHLRTGQNTIEIVVGNEGGPAGLIAAIQLKDKSDQFTTVVSDGTWLACRGNEYDWKKAEVVGPVGMAPWHISAQGDAVNSLVFERDTPFTARALIVKGQMNGQLFAVRNGERELVAQINTGGRNPTTDFLPDGVETFSFEEVTAQEFILEPCLLPGEQVELTSAPTVAQVVEKQLGRMHPTPSPTWESYIFPATVEPSDKSVLIRQNEIIDLTDKLSENGILTCQLPAGEWTILYFGMATTGKINSPAPPEATGLEVDKMSRPLIEYHFQSMFGEMLAELTPEERKAFRGITIDSYEKGSQNWTDNFIEEFEKRNGYSPLKLLPVFTGRVVDSAKTSDGFLWDLRRTIADMIATEYVEGLADIAHKNDLRLWCENYGHWGFPGEFLIYGGRADMIGGEFWTGGHLGDIECRAASSAAHIYGKPTVYAEAFTSGLNLGYHPYTLKARGEQFFSMGVNHFVLHVYAAQPRDGVPGKNPWFGTAFHRNTPWFNHAQDWVKYLQRCHLMLHMGRPAAEIAVYIGDFAPQMTGPANPVPAGYDYDYMGSDALLRTVKRDGTDLVVRWQDDPSRIASRYKVLAANAVAMEKLRPKVRARIEELVKNGVTMIDQVPVPAETLRKLGIEPMVSKQTCPIKWTARELDNGKLFFLSNFGQTGPFEVTLRVSGKSPELFNPVTGQIRKLARYWKDGNGTRIAFNVHDRADSFFVVFRDALDAASVVKATSNGNDVSAADLALWYDHKGRLIGQTSQPGTYTLSMSDGTQHKLIADAKPQSFNIETEWETIEQQDGGFTVVRQTEFTLPESFGKGQQVLLDMGDVQVMAKATLNGKTYDTLWMPPFELDVTDAIKPGKNRLKILITSTTQTQPRLGKTVKLKTESRVTAK